MKQLDKAKEEIAYFMRRLYQQKLTTTSGGNLSVKIDDKVLITPSALDKGTIQADQIGVMDLAGNIIGPAFKPSIESELHLAVYRQRPDISAIVHAHPTTTCSLAATDIPINTRLGSEAYAILGDIAYAEYAIMGSMTLAENVAGAAVDSNCVIMHNHGALTVGKTLLEAFDRLEVLENAAIITLNLLQLPTANVLPLKEKELREIDKLMKRN